MLPDHNFQLQEILLMQKNNVWVLRGYLEGQQRKSIVGNQPLRLHVRLTEEKCVSSRSVCDSQGTVSLQGVKALLETVRLFSDVCDRTRCSCFT